MAQTTRFILASTSPRRIQLMAQAGFKCKIIAPSTDETPGKNEKPRDLVARLALDKARSVARKLGPSKERIIIISADTIVVEPLGKKILGKPISRKDAEKMLKCIQGATHCVLTAYCILELDPVDQHAFSLVRAVKSKVTLRPLSIAQIRSYISTGEPMDKAGSYAAQGIGMNFIESIEGSYTNVVGLPMAQLIQDLEHEFEVKI